MAYKRAVCTCPSCTKFWETAYRVGALDPNYPVPVTQENADRALNWLNLTLCEKGEVPCNGCIDRFIWCLEVDHG